VPEILRVNLTTLVLTLKCIGVDDVLKFDYMAHPGNDYLIEALK
jgi:HrpA-like RNA helicase